MYSLKTVTLAVLSFSALAVAHPSEKRHEGDFCDRLDACYPGYYCRNSMCMPEEKKAKRQDCGQTSDCPIGELCADDGTCVSADGPYECEDGSDCANGYECRSWTCSPIEEKVKRQDCGQTSDCPIGELCADDGTCVSADGPYECEDGSDCANGYECRSWTCSPIEE